MKRLSLRAAHEVCVAWFEMSDQMRAAGIERGEKFAHSQASLWHVIADILYRLKWGVQP